MGEIIGSSEPDDFPDKLGRNQLTVLAWFLEDAFRPDTDDTLTLEEWVGQEYPWFVAGMSQERKEEWFKRVRQTGNAVLWGLYSVVDEAIFRATERGVRAGKEQVLSQISAGVGYTKNNILNSDIRMVEK